MTDNYKERVVKTNTSRIEKANPNTEVKKKSKLTSGQRTLLLVMKILAIPVIGFIMFMIGMATGYKYGGGAAGEVFDASVWRNILLIIFG